MKKFKLFVATVVCFLFSTLVGGGVYTASLLNKSVNKIKAETSAMATNLPANNSQAAEQGIRINSAALGSAAICDVEISDENGNLVDLSQVNNVVTNQVQDVSGKRYSAAVVFEPIAKPSVIEVTKGTYTINKGTISGVTGTNGGAIYVGNGATLIMNGGIISNCSAENGGAIYVDQGGRLIINGGTITNCSATASNGRGGAIYLRTNQDCYISGLTIDSCTANQYGGAIYNLTSNILTIGKGTNITECTAAKGSAMYINHGDVSFYGSIESCIAQGTNENNNGTIYVGNNSTLTLGSSCKIANCIVNGKGGAVYITYEATVTLQSGAEISQCSAESGGAIYGNYLVKIAILGGSIDNCEADYRGGAIRTIGQAQLDISNATISNCSASYGGAVSAESSSICNFSSGIIKNCNANEGGAVFVHSEAQFSMTGGKISNCTAINYGGGVRGGYKMLILSNGTIENCSARTGGGVYATGVDMYNCGVQMTDFTLSGCSSSYNGGGGVYCNGTLQINGGSIIDCSAQGDYNGGGGVAVNGDASIINASFINCHTVVRGGAIFLSSGAKAHIVANIDNCSAVDGGGIYASSNCNVLITGGYINGCIASRNGGGINANGADITIDDKNFYITNCTANQGGGIRLAFAKLTFNNGYIGDKNYATSTSYVTSSTASNKAAQGGGLWLSTNSKATINSGAHIVGNYATIKGGGVVVDGIENGNFYNTTLVLNGGNIRANATAGYGGGVCVDGALVAYSGTLRYNYAPGIKNNSYGYDIYIDELNGDCGVAYINTSKVSLSGSFNSSTNAGVQPYLGGDWEYYPISNYRPTEAVAASDIVLYKKLDLAGLSQSAQIEPQQPTQTDTAAQMGDVTSDEVASVQQTSQASQQSQVYTLPADYKGKQYAILQSRAGGEDQDEAV